MEGIVVLKEYQDWMWMCEAQLFCSLILHLL